MNRRGFTIVELLIVIVVIAILASITIVAYNGIQTRARAAKIDTDLSLLQKAIISAKINQNQLLTNITGRGYTAQNCTAFPSGTNLAEVNSSDACWTWYSATLTAITNASGINVTGLKDPYGRPYFIDENESASSCTKDQIGTYTNPFVTGPAQNRSIDIPFYRTDC